MADSLSTFNHANWVGGVWTRAVSMLWLLLSQKVVGGAPSNMGLSAAGRGIEDEEVVVHLLVDFHDSGLVAAPVAVVWRRKDGHDLLLVTPVVSVHHQLVGARDRLQPVLLVELRRHVHAERVARAAGAHPPPLTILRVRPKKVAHRAFMRDLLNAVQFPDIVE
jgi:hypothetical protein